MKVTLRTHSLVIGRTIALIILFLPSFVLNHLVRLVCFVLFVLCRTMPCLARVTGTRLISHFAGSSIGDNQTDSDPRFCKNKSA